MSDDDSPCAICENAPATVEALLDDQHVRVCSGCFAYETGEDPDEVNA